MVWQGWRLAVALVTFVILLAGAQALTGALGSEGISIKLGHAQLGDRFDYEHRVEGTGTNETWQFQLEEGPVMHVPDGSNQATHRLVQAVKNWIGADGFQAWNYAVGTNRLVAVQTEFSHGSAQAGTAPIHGPSEYESVQLSTKFLASEAPPCFLTLAGQRVSAGSVVDVPKCTGPFQLPRARLQASGPEMQQGRPTLRLTGPSGPGTLDIWVAEGIPVPVAIAFDLQRDDKVEHHTLDLLGFEEGFADIPGPQQATHSGPPPVISLAPSRFFLNDTGIDTPFPLAQAVDGLTGQGTDPRVMAFMVRHPNAVISFADLSIVDTTNTTRIRWSLVIQEGQDGLSAKVSKFVPKGTPNWMARLTPVHVLQAVEEGTAAAVPTMGHSLPLADLSSVAAAFGQNITRSYGYGLLQQAAWTESDDLSALEATPTLRPSVQLATKSHWERTTFDVDGQVTSIERTSFHGMFSAQPRTAAAPLPVDDTSATGPPGLAAALAPWPSVKLGALAATASLLVWLALGLKGSSPLVGLFSRLTEEDIRDHPVRQQLMACIGAQPGIHQKELARITGISNGSLFHHLRRLADAGKITRQRMKGYVCYYAAGVEHQPHADATKSRGAQLILGTLRRMRHANATELHEETGLSQATVHHHLRRLEHAGLLSIERVGRTLAIRLRG